MALTFAEVTTSPHVSNADWVRGAETALQRLQADIDGVHRRILMSPTEEASSDSDDDASYESLTETQVDNLESSSVPDGILQINKLIMHLLLQVWNVELNDLFEEQRAKLGFQILMAVNDWEILKESIEAAEN
ncbi:hypothetical protein DBV05_g9034 [Lasiodiplodia theobromae]|uniref:Uncharacterized protein n=1 Tax=Lasiodiplodia theobromae TaxID=45133 RepID=A0A5N5D3M6_9PEZI|nr:hypothetical protein DBV05_g9034 [Lasiodiplodia theobromae]